LEHSSLKESWVWGFNGLYDVGWHDLLVMSTWKNKIKFLMLNHRSPVVVF
jgi:hypothetical protein